MQASKGNRKERDMAVSSQAQQFIDMLRAGKNPNQGQERPDPEKTLAEREALRKNADRMCVWCR